MCVVCCVKVQYVRVLHPTAMDCKVMLMVMVMEVVMVVMWDVYESPNVMYTVYI